MKYRTARTITLPAMAGALLCAPHAHGQIQPGGYTCSTDVQRTHNNSLDITARTLTCALPTVMGHWYDLSNDPDLAGQYSVLKCVDWSLWSSSYPLDQVVTVRVYQDTTPDSRSPVCPGQGYGSTSEPGPDVASQVLLWEQTTIFPPSTAGVNSTTIPRPDGDRSVVFDGPSGTGILIEPSIAIFIEVGHLGEAVTRFGTNSAGEAGDATGGPEVTWVKAPGCNGGGCVTQLGTTVGDWAKWSEFVPGTNRDFVMRANFQLGDCSCAPPLKFCSTDIFGPGGVPDMQTDVVDLLALLGTWGTLAPPRPLGDVAPLPRGDNLVNIIDLLALLSEWGACPDSNSSCSDLLGFLAIYFDHPASVIEGVFEWSLDGHLDGPPRPATNDYNDVLAGPTECGWYDYGAGGIPGGFRYGDAFGIDASTGAAGGDAWFVYNATCDGPKIISTAGDCGPGDVTDTVLEVYALGAGLLCPESWTELIACDDSSDPGCGDHASIELFANSGERFLIRIGGKFGETGAGMLSIQPKQFGTPDCNSNGFLDAYDICTQISFDTNDNGIPDDCEPLMELSHGK